jgi:hypothetical protein
MTLTLNFLGLVLGCSVGGFIFVEDLATELKLLSIPEVPNPILPDLAKSID